VAHSSRNARQVLKVGLDTTLTLDLPCVLMLNNCPAVQISSVSCSVFTASTTINTKAEAFKDYHFKLLEFYCKTFLAIKNCGQC
jgi:hypothetical protein